MALRVIWDWENDPASNVQHIQEHDVAIEEVEKVLANHLEDWTYSHTSGQPITFGWTSTGRHLAVVFEWVEEDEPAVRPVTAYDAPPPRRRGRRDKRRKR